MERNKQPLFKISKIIKTNSEYNFITKDLFCGREIKTELLYRGSENNFTAKSFHEKCDEKGPTLSIIENEFGKKFGGFASISWSKKNGRYLKGDNCFVFSLNHKEQYNQSKIMYSCLKSISYSPKKLCVFGEMEIAIVNECDKNRSDSYLGIDYVIPEGISKSEYINRLSGKIDFIVREIEVFKIIFN